VLVILLSACQPGFFPAAPAISQPTASLPAVQIAENTALPTATHAKLPEASNTPEAHLMPTASETAIQITSKGNDAPAQPLAEPSPTSSAFSEHTLSAEEWKEWPVIPQAPQAIAELYRRGLVLGNNPHAFSILGDCQSLPETFLGVYDTDPDLVAGLPDDLRETVANFAGSFERQSPTIKGGTTAGAILWAEWHEREFTCADTESPLSCELRLHQPSIVIINLGTHYETRNITYLRKILDQLIVQGIVPVLSTKADNREMDERLNLEMAQLAIEYDLPLWNFWAAVSDLPNNGVEIKEGEEHLGEIYLSEVGLERHRLTALQVISAVWQAVK
jgi:hypothetical protein